MIRNEATKENSSPSPATLVDVLVAVGTHLESEVEEALREVGVTRGTFQVLRVLHEAPDGVLSQGLLAARLRRTAGTLSVRLGRLERAGLLNRSAHPHDRRAARVEITSRGRRLFEQARPLYEQRASRLVAALPGPAAELLDEHLHAWLGFFEPSEDDAPRLGVTVAPSATAARLRRAVGLPEATGVLVVRVDGQGAAARAGLARGDLVTGADGVDVRTVADLDRAVRRARETVALRAVRGVEPLDLEVRLDPR